MTKKKVNNDQLITEIIKGIEEVKGTDIQLFDLREIENTVTDYFVICTGNSNTQVSAISGSVQKTVSKELQPPPLLPYHQTRLLQIHHPLLLVPSR